MTRIESITAPDGQSFDGYTVLPESGSGPGVLVLQEIFGVNEYIKDVCRRFADVGFVAMAPDVFWRTDRNVEIGTDPGEMPKAFEYMSSYDWSVGGADLAAALDHLRALPETTDKVGVVGFCFGGGTSFALAVNAQPDAVVSYYGSAVPGLLGGAGSVTAPICFHFGSNDDFIPTSDISAVRLWASGRDNCEFHEYAAGHAFDNSFSPMFSNPPAAQQAWPHTVRFLATHLGL